MTKILFGTRNSVRLEFLKGILMDLPFEILSLNDMDINTRVDETGNDPTENAKLKAREYYKYAQIPTFSIDSGLFIDKFPLEKQPGVFVRRINKTSYEATDEEMLAYYIRELNNYGGFSSACWVNAISIAVSEEKIFSTVIKRETLLSSERCEAHTLGEPLNSIQIDTRNNKYVAELSVEEKIESQKVMVDAIRKFFVDHIECIQKHEN